jgi:membrane protease YdiL (CAAX protease family)
MNHDPLSHPVRGLAVGLVLAFVLPWLVWSTAIAEQRGLIGWHVPQSLAFWVGLPAAYLVGAAVSAGPAGLVDLVSRLLRWRTGWRPWLAAVGLAAGLPLVAWLGVLATGAVSASALAWQGAPVALLVETALFWLTEEALWRGFVLPRLEVRLTPGQAGLALGVVWALWHLPLFAIAGSFQSGLPYAGFFVLTVATSVILSWLYHRSGGSVPVCALFHGVIDVMFVVTGVLSISPAAFWTVVGVHVAVAAVLWWRGALRPVPAAA